MPRLRTDSTIRQKRPRWRTTFDLSLIVVVVSVVYWPVLTHRYAFTDDFWVFFSGDDVSQIYRSAGRPIIAVAWLAIQEPIDRVVDLAVLRLFSLACVCALACQLYVLARRITKLRAARFGVALSVAALPSITVQIAWATCWMYPLAALLALWAGLVAERAVRSTNEGAIKAALLLIASLGVLLVALGIYQPAAGWYWIVPLAGLLDCRFMRMRKYRTRVLAQCAVGLPQFAACFMALKLYFAATGIAAQERSQLIHDPAAKLYALFRIQIPLVLDQWQVVDTARKPLMIAIAAFVALLLSAGTFRFFRRYFERGGGERNSKTTALVWLVLLLGVLAMTHVHWWAVDYNAKNYRTAGALAAGVTIALWWSLLQLLGSHGIFGSRRRLTTAVSIAVICIALWKGRANLDRFWIYPYSRAYSFTVDELRAGVTPAVTHIHVIRQTADEGIVTERNIYNFGRPFTDFDWAIEELIRAALADGGVYNNVEEITHGLADEPIPSGHGVYVIDMRELVRFRR